MGISSTEVTVDRIAELDFKYKKCSKKGLGIVTDNVTSIQCCSVAQNSQIYTTKNSMSMSLKVKQFFSPTVYERNINTNWLLLQTYVIIL